MVGVKMARTWITGCTHFSHTNIIKYANRPFSSVEEMDNAIVTNWNAVVGDVDTVIHLGSIGWRNIDGIVSQLKGNKILIAGCHDKNLSPKVKSRFLKIMPLWNTHIGDITVTFCHFPMMEWDKSKFGALHLFSHGHGAMPEIYNLLSWDMSVDVWDFKPVPWEAIIAKYEHKKENWRESFHSPSVGRSDMTRQAALEGNRKFLNLDK
jgi:calcineurin-like phosphoesterase family protein